MRDSTARNIAITVAVAFVIVMVVILSDVWGADFKPPAFWGEGVDSAKWFITLADGSHWDSTAGAARAYCARYDTTITGLSNDTAYLVTLRMWDGSDSASTWIFYWPILTTAIADIQAELDGLVMYFGACDGCYQILYPRSGTANKDSVIVIDPSLGNDSLVGKIVFYHGTTQSVYDSTYYYIDEPW